MNITIPDTYFESARISEPELYQEIALLLFQKDKLTLAQASRLAQMNRLQFQHFMSSRNVSVHYDVKDFESDIQTLKRLKRIF